MEWRHSYIGVDDVRIVCMGESVTHPRAPFGTRRVRYRHYLPELARKPHAVRQVAPELIAELGAPWSGLWELLTEAHGEREAARVLARLLGAVCEHGEERVRRALEVALSRSSQEYCRELKLAAVVRDSPGLCRRARNAGWAYEDLLRELLEAEITNRHRSTAHRLLREARFSDIKTLDQIDWAALRGVSRYSWL